MPDGLNRVMLMGNLGADPELRFGNSPDTCVLKLRLATTESYFDKRSNERKERTDWHNVVIFGKRGEALQKILAKGSTVFVEGRLQTSSYEKNGEKRYSTDVVATNVILAGRCAPRGDDAPARSDQPRERTNFGAASGAYAQRPADDMTFGPGASDPDDIPF